MQVTNERCAEKQITVGHELYRYDPMGRLTASNQQIAGQTYAFTYMYNVAGDLTSETYPSGRVITMSYDGENRTSQAAGAYASATTKYVSGLQYAAHGAPSQFSYANGLQSSQSFNTL